MLGLMSIRGRQAVEGGAPDGDDDRARGMFGGLNLILAGDPMQLPPVSGAPMCAGKPNAIGHTVERRAVWLGVNACVELTEVIRQQGHAQAAFRATLISVAEGRPNLDNYRL